MRYETDETAQAAEASENRIHNAAIEAAAREVCPQCRSGLSVSEDGLHKAKSIHGGHALVACKAQNIRALKRDAR